MAFQRLNGSIIADLALMCFGVVMAAISLFANLALTLLGYVAIAGADDLPHPVAAAAILFMLIMGGWNLLASIQLVDRPDRVVARAIAVRSVLAMCPVFIIVAVLFFK